MSSRLPSDSYRLNNPKQERLLKYRETHHLLTLGSSRSRRGSLDEELFDIPAELMPHSAPCVCVCVCAITKHRGLPPAIPADFSFFAFAHWLINHECFNCMLTLMKRVDIIYQLGVQWGDVGRKCLLTGLFLISSLARSASCLQKKKEKEKKGYRFHLAVLK